ncbi:carbonic anhydrase [Lysobacter sp. cf310]|uniref:carbonic anhydrase n=1 Tax=Lysobacter sp. cf310 TaxID=1761790 RepID=UPI0008E3CED6|nr:carbonic anhydrase family protein [Lysobacter sp. cf310]SFK82543.1 carbonic anhydrase [Lysobacter sp. cf310]
MTRRLSLLSIICTSLLLTSASVAAELPHWGYEHGTVDWGDLHPSYALCSSGTRQSPIDVIRANARVMSLPSLTFNYSTSANVTVVNAGHTIRTDMPAGNTLSVAGRTYKLDQFHVHTPSENYIDGEQYPLELHFVHTATDGSGAIAVVGVLFDEGARDPQLDKIIAAMPAHEGQSAPARALNLRALIPSGRSYRFSGSLTTPDCRENLAWHVMGRVRTASLSQLAAFSARFSGPEFPQGNRRPVQPLNGRPVSTEAGGD